MGYFSPGTYTSLVRMQSGLRDNAGSSVLICDHLPHAMHAGVLLHVQLDLLYLTLRHGFFDGEKLVPF